MHIDHAHFYVENAQRSRDWFVHTLGFESVTSSATPDTDYEVVCSGLVFFVLASARRQSSPVAQYLKWQPPGVVDVAFRVADLPAVISHAVDAQAKVLQGMQTDPELGLKWAAIAGWGSLRHTLVERGQTPLLPLADGAGSQLVLVPEQSPTNSGPFTGIDHVVLNVAGGDLQAALSWYQRVLGFQPQRSFEIQTPRSALCSQVMVHPQGTAQFPINQPGSPNSQIQEFLDANRGAGIQHLALKTVDIVQAIAQLCQRGVSFLAVPGSYYTQLQRRHQNLPDIDWQAIAAHQVLVDWQEQTPDSVLLQTFTQPIFAQPTFFFELIERRQQAQGFGEGNFLALFEAIEREQIKRGSLA